MNLVKFPRTSRQLLAIPIFLRFQGGRPPAGGALPRDAGAWRGALQTLYCLLCAAVLSLSGRSRSPKPGNDLPVPKAYRQEELRKLRARLAIVCAALESAQAESGSRPQRPNPRS